MFKIIMQKSKNNLVEFNQTTKQVSLIESCNSLKVLNDNKKVIFNCPLARR